MSAKTPGRSIEKFVQMIKAQLNRPVWTSHTWWTSTPAIIAVVGVLVSAMLFAIYQSGAQADVVSAATIQKRADTQAARAELAARPDAAPAARNNAKNAAATTRVTITGCLERDSDSFRLTDTAGSSSPQSRSWKTGFLKKRPAKLDVVDGSNRLNLSRHVGSRVSVTGTLLDKEITASSVQRVAASCKA
jgi:hypothetical protein